MLAYCKGYLLSYHSPHIYLAEHNMLLEWPLSPKGTCVVSFTLMALKMHFTSQGSFILLTPNASDQGLGTEIQVIPNPVFPRGNSFMRCSE